MIRIMLNISPEECNALSELAKHELRSPRDQLRMIVRHALQENGLLTMDIPKSITMKNNTAQRGNKIQTDTIKDSSNLEANNG